MPVWVVLNKRGPTFTLDEGQREVLAAYRLRRDARAVLAKGQTIERRHVTVGEKPWKSVR